MEAKPNLIAVLLAAVAHFLLGAAWFTLFARPWTAGLRMSPSEIQAAQQNPALTPYIVAFVCNLILAYAIAWVLSRLHEQNVLRGIGVGAVLGFVAAAAMLTELAFEQRPSSFCWIAVGYPFVGSILMGIIIGAWKKGKREAAIGTA
jgi:hypothetical protein